MQTVEQQNQGTSAEVKQGGSSMNQIRSEEVVCPLCRNSGVCAEPNLSILLKLENTHRQVVRCESCGFRFLNPFLGDAEIEQLYNTESEYFDNYVGTPYLQIANEKLGYYREVRSVLERRLNRKGRILDVGSATGHFLSVFKANGWEVQGLEISDWCRDYAEKYFGIHSTKASLETSRLPKKYFDVISMNHVLEHLRYPLDALRKLSDWLRDDGMLCIEVPNEFNDLIFTLSGNWGRRRLYNLSGPILHHQLFFTPKSLRTALAGTGFTVIETRTSSWRSPVPCHLFRSHGLNSAALSLRKGMLLAGSLVEKGEFILCLASKQTSSSAQVDSD